MIFVHPPPCPLSLSLSQHGLLYPGGSRPRSSLFPGGPLGYCGPQSLHAAAAPALLPQDRPAEPRVAVERGSFSVSVSPPQRLRGANVNLHLHQSSSPEDVPVETCHVHGVNDESVFLEVHLELSL